MNRLYQLLGLTKRAGKIIKGDELMKAVRTNKVYLVLMRTTSSLRSRKMLRNKTTFYHIPFVMVDADLINHAIGETNVGAIGISDQKLAERLNELCKEGGYIDEKKQAEQ